MSRLGRARPSNWLAGSLGQQRPPGFYQGTVAFADSGTGSDSVAVAVAVSLSDSGTGTDTVLSGEPVTFADSGSGTDSVAVAPAVPEADSGAGADSVSVAVAVTFTDAGSGTDTVLSGEPVTFADSGAGSDSVALLKTGPFPLLPLAMKFEILVNGTWTDISSYVYQRSDIVITRGLPDETQSATPAQVTLTLNNRDGRFSTKNASGAYYPYLVRNTQLRVSISQLSATGELYSGYRFWGETSSLPVAWDPTGNDVYASITVSGPFRRYVQSAPIGSAMEQYYAGLVAAGSSFAPYGCWPCEDGSNATQFSSLLPGGSAMTWTGTPSLSSSSAFGGSDPLPALSGSTWHGQTGAAAGTTGSGTISRTLPGSYLWKCPAGVTAVTSVECDAGGGAGGDTDGTTGGSGGGGGEKAAESTVGVTAGTTYDWSVGAGGLTATGDPGTAGGNSTFAGGTKTVTAHGGGGGGYAGQAAGAGGTGSSNTTHSNGGAGALGQSSSTSGGSDTLNGSDGGGGQTTQNWTAPSGFTLATIAAQAGGGGGANGSGWPGSEQGGAGGGGGGYSYGSLAITPAHVYTMKAGNGGSAQSTGGASSCTGDSATVSANGGAGATGRFSAGAGGSGTTAYGYTGQVGAIYGGVENFAGNGGGRGYDNSGVGFSNDGGNGFNGVGGGGGGGSGDGSGGNGGGGFITWTWGTSGTPSGGGGGGSAYAGGASGSSAGDGGDSGSAGGGGVCGPSVSTPSVPATTVAYTSTYDFAVTVTVTGGTVTNVKVNGTTVGSGDGTYLVPAAGSMELTYSAAPAWSWASLSPDGITPGGGGAGAVSVTGSTAVPAGNGAPGRTTFTWSGGTTATPVAADIVRFFLGVPAAGTTDGAVLLSILTYGTVAQCDVIYHAGGFLELAGYSSTGSTLFDSGSLYYGANGVPLYVDVELVQSGSSVDWSLNAIQPGVNRIIAPTGCSGSISGTVLYVSDVIVDPDGTVTDSTVAGWVTVQAAADTLANLVQVTSGYDGELAATRASRLCTAAGLGFELTGNASDTPQMGPQQDDTLLNILQSCADMDRGQLFETRDQFGVGYRTRVSMQNQSPALTAYYADSVLSAVPVPTEDDQYVRNYVTVTRNNGGSATVIITSGAMSIQAPPNGAGNYTYTQTVQAYADSQLPNLAQWIADVGTVDEYRFPRLTFSMARPEAATLFATIPALDAGDYVEVPDPPSFLQSAAVKQLVLGYTETLNAYKWDIAYNCVPESPYEGGSLPTW